MLLLFITITLGFAVLSGLVGLGLAWNEREHLWDWMLQGGFAGLQLGLIVSLAKTETSPVVTLVREGFIGLLAFAFLLQLVAVGAMLKEDRKNHLAKKQV
jgi:hypothetical protein